MVGLEVIDRFVEGMQPEVFADEDDCVEFVLEARRVTRDPLHQAPAHPLPELLQLLRNVALHDQGEAGQQRAGTELEGCLCPLPSFSRLTLNQASYLLASVTALLHVGHHLHVQELKQALACCCLHCCHRHHNDYSFFTESEVFINFQNGTGYGYGSR